MEMRRRFKQVVSLKDRLIQQAQNFRKQAKGMPGRIQREELLKKAREAEWPLTWMIGFRPQVSGRRNNAFSGPLCFQIRRP
jgi:hypothetical protein